MTEFMLGVVVGVGIYVGYKSWRAMRSDEWDSSNFLNFLRLESFTAMYPEKFGYMYYLTNDQINKLIDFGWNNIDEQRPFNYINKDEFSENFPGSRPE